MHEHMLLRLVGAWFGKAVRVVLQREIEREQRGVPSCHINGHCIYDVVLQSVELYCFVLCLTIYCHRA
jgi:hypothetical protein